MLLETLSYLSFDASRMLNSFMYRIFLMNFRVFFFRSSIIVITDREFCLKAMKCFAGVSYGAVFVNGKTKGLIESSSLGLGDVNCALYWKAKSKL